MPIKSSRPAAQRAVVLGASLAGLLAARVLSEHFDEVVLLERDVLPEGAARTQGNAPRRPSPRPAGERAAWCWRSFSRASPRQWWARGGLLGDLQRDAAFEAGRRRFATGVAGLPALCASRLAIEAEIRGRVLLRAGVRIVCAADVRAPAFEAGRVTAARYAVGGVEYELPAALVVDCTGRGSRAPQWLQAWGLEAPAEERVDIGICYTSAYFKRSGACAMGQGLDKVATFGAVTNEQPRPGVLLAQEPEGDGPPRWVAGVGGFAGDHAAATLEALRERARDISAAPS